MHAYPERFEWLIYGAIAASDLIAALCIRGGIWEKQRYAKIANFGMRPAARMKVWLESVDAILHPQKPWMDRLICTMRRAHL